MKGFKIVSQERENGAIRGFVQQSGALYRFELLVDGTLTLWRVRDGVDSAEPVNAPKTAAMLRRKLQD